MRENLDVNIYYDWHKLNIRLYHTTELILNNNGSCPKSKEEGRQYITLTFVSKTHWSWRFLLDKAVSVWKKPIFYLIWEKIYSTRNHKYQTRRFYLSSTVSHRGGYIWCFANEFSQPHYYTLQAVISSIFFDFICSNYFSSLVQMAHSCSFLYRLSCSCLFEL